MIGKVTMNDGTVYVMGDDGRWQSKQDPTGARLMNLLHADQNDGVHALYPKGYVSFWLTVKDLRQKGVKKVDAPPEPELEPGAIT